MPERRAEYGVLPRGERSLEPGGIDDQILTAQRPLEGRKSTQVDPLAPYGVRSSGFPGSRRARLRTPATAQPGHQAHGFSALPALFATAR
ncbi:hypothetical protein [Streptomyces sp. NBC_01217]|uniref:hypothetical protein n=1 Tax=Streptomyces sp. NBC_01217 TaxID=2903779 RepID=UPI002E0E40CA|nr:hypothetical protein OG507_21420 [Streptomyces sp. NBC_01217]